MAFNIPKLNTFVIPIITNKHIDKCLETLYTYTERGSFYVFIIDQTLNGLDINLRDKYKNLMIIRTAKSDFHPTGNLGHSQGSNLGISLVQTPYVTFLNDDVEFIDSRWFQGILDTFDQVAQATPNTPAMLVNTASIKLPDWSVGRKDGDDFYILPYKEKYTAEDYDFLVNEEHYVNEHLTIQPGSVIDGINLYCSIADTKRLLDVGLTDEFWYPGNANDYDLSCRAGMKGYRCVSSTKSWVFHHWSVSFHSDEERNALVQPELNKGDLREKWGDKLDIWGVKCEYCEKEGKEIRLHTKDNIIATCPNHPENIYNIPQNTIMPL